MVAANSSAIYGLRAVEAARCKERISTSYSVIYTPYKESLSLQPLQRGAHRFSQAKFQALSAWEPQEGAAKVRHLKLAISISNRSSEDN